ncbi:hypothetical protein AWB67_02897 [Caballeronia terrestris]|uniref:Teichuronopeptide biosynthesis TupA-like protein n=1 Tax=Caballeronia terrestris TaxID=1226301 RepID=A0A158IVD3_9BURK|nr:ATP-grasp fold amidoligase family protein [Caballeronia terrestris]SAL60001.1 hypothetical protein AWB67_02897 [Caballeronia terrestris]
MSLSKTIAGSVKELLPDSVFLSLSHRMSVGRFPDLVNPVTFNEKIVYRCLHPDPRFANLTDKLLVRDFVIRTIGEEHLIPLLSSPDHFTKDVFDALPSSFVMKANHGSGYVKVIHDKAETSFEELSALSERWLAANFYRVARERHYEHIKPRIFFEALLTDQSGNIPADFKIHCFNQVAGKQKAFILHISDRFTPHPRGDFYDEDWNQLDIRIGHYPNSAVPSPRPDNLDEILRNAKQLSANFDYVRVDLYAPDDRIFFGELTFTPGAGVYRLTPDQIDYDWGRMLQAHSSSAGLAASPVNVPR